MNRIQKFLLQIFLVEALCSTGACGLAQDAKLHLDSLDKLGEKAAHMTEVTLDGSLLQFAIKIIESDEGDADLKDIQSIVKGLKGIYIKSFEFDANSQYSKADVDAVRSQLTTRWTKIVQSIDKRSNEHNEIYLLKNGEQVAGIAILVAEPRELTVVNIVGDVPLDKISSLQHHFVSKEKDHGKSGQQKKEGSHEDE